MPLTAGARLGPYEIVSVLGVGGMGEVYRARDTRLKRDVALKILPESFAADLERLARFQREAEVLASLNHPNIAAIYGFEESSPSPTSTSSGQAAVQALVLELVEGPTLADVIAGRGAAEVEGLRSRPRRSEVAPARGGGAPRGLELGDALPIARQIAEALEAAHEHGIIHRDLKPANIKITPDGLVKVLDFGLAKALAPEPGSAAAVQLSQSSTITSPAMMTGVGMILGTAAYMAPEQAKGRPADKRSDLWAFGCVLYEMLTGKRPFDGEDLTEVLGAVVRLEPEWDAVPPDVPLPVRTLLRTCLTKDRRKRTIDATTALFVLDNTAGLAGGSVSQDAGDARVHVDEAVADARRSSSRSTQRQVVLSSAAALTVGLVVAGVAVWLLTRPAPASVVRTTITTSGSAALSLSGVDRDLAITPDGSRVVYRGNNQLLMRALNQLEPTVLSGLGAPRGVFISPDGEWVGFFDSNTIKKVAITGGPPVTITSGDGGAPRGATWGPDGTIVYSTAVPNIGLQRVSAAGGDPTVLTKPHPERGEADHLWPEFLPGRQAVLFTITAVTGGLDNAQIAVLDLQSRTSKVLIRGGSHAHYVPSGLGSSKRAWREGGYLAYNVAGTLRAVAFDLGRLEVVGTPAPVLEGVVTTAQGAADVAVAANGSLVYVPGVAGVGGRQTVVSVDRQGRASPLPGLPLDSYRDVRVSPDGARLALATQDDVWIYDLTRATLSRLTTHPASDTLPLWTPDGQRLIFTSNRAGYPELFWRPADGTGSDERLLARAKDLVDLRADGWSADGRQLLFTEWQPSRQCAIGQITVERPSEVKLLVKSEFCNGYAAVSPDGRWMAYESNVSGRTEIYVERCPELGNRQLISTGVGRRPLWSRDGRELFFGTLDGRQMFTVPVQSGTTLVAGRPQVLFEFAMLAPGVGNRPYDIAPDGRFLIIRFGQADVAGGTASNIIVVQNWTEELKRLVPIN